MLTAWLRHVDELRSQYDWLLFFNVPKLLLLYHLLLEENPNLEAIVHEISFLCSNEQGALESVRVAVEVREKWRISERGKWTWMSLILYFFISRNSSGAFKTA